MKNKIVIAVTGPEQGGFFPWFMTRRALKRLGVKAVRVTTKNHQSLSSFQGLILGGGSDINPEHYGEALEEITENQNRSSLKERLLSLMVFLLRALFSIKLRQAKRDPQRDELEKRLCRQALLEEKPILGICRGAQLLNITLGGSLHQSTLHFYTETPAIKTVRPLRQVFVDPDSKLAEIFATGEVKVNSLHEQAINRLGDGMRICARDSNGIVQAIEHCDRDFVIGVQWHPEYLPRQKDQHILFKKFVEACK